MLFVMSTLILLVMNVVACDVNVVCDGTLTSHAITVITNSINVLVDVFCDVC
jgi:hypothetical protein